jgi:hypothetical protein
MDKYKIIFDSKKLTFEEKINLSEKLIRHEVNKSINFNILQAFNNQIVWSEFENKYLNTENIWENKTFYYYGDYTEKDLKNDWRFKEVKGKRGLAEFKKLVAKDNRLNLKQNSAKDYIKYLDKK